MTLLQRLLRTRSLSAEDGLHPTGLPQTLGLFTLTMIGVGATIGTGIFFVMAEAVPKAGPAVLLSFLIAGITAGLTALCYAELSSAIPASGSSYSFAYAGLGELAAFVVAACMSLEYALAGSATAIGWSGYLNNFTENAFQLSIPEAWRSPMFVKGEHGIVVSAGHFNLPPVILVALCGLLLLRGTKESATVNAVMVVVKLAVLTFFVVIALSALQMDRFTPFYLQGGGMHGVTAAAGTVFFSFVGLDTIATAGAEVRNPRRNLPLGIMLALLIVTVSYVAVAVAALGAQPLAKFAGQESALSEILKDITGRSWPSMVLSAGAVISVFSVTLLIVFGQTRILYAISKDGLIPKIFQRLCGRRQVPAYNTLLVCVAIAAVAGFVDSSYLWDMVSLGTLVAFVAVSLCVPVMRARLARAGIAAHPDAYRLQFGAYAVPTLSVLACLYVMHDLPAVTFQAFAMWIGCALAAYFAYLLLTRNR